MHQDATNNINEWFLSHAETQEVEVPQLMEGEMMESVEGKTIVTLGKARRDVVCSKQLSADVGVK